MAPARKIRPLNRMFTEAAIAAARSYVDHVFNNSSDRHDTIRRNPFTSGNYVSGLDPIEPQIEQAVLAVLARQWFTDNGPADADLQPLPLGYDERESLKKGGAPHILAWYARSLETLDYDVIEHPSFYDYACGVMASSEHAPAFITEDQQLKRRFPPRRLSGLICGLYWQPEKERERRRPSILGKRTHR